MDKLKRLIKDSRLRTAALLLAIGFGFVLGLGVLRERAREEGKARKSETALAFEKEPVQWLAKPQELTAFQRALEEDQLATVGVSGAVVLYTLRDGARHSTVVPGCTQASCAGTVLPKLSELGTRNGFALTQLDIDPRTPTRQLLDALASMVAPAISLMLLGLVGYLVYTMQSGGDKKAGKLTEKPTTKFADVVGADEAKAALRRVEAFMRNPAGYVEMGARPPRGVLLEGPPGTGKTLLARALAGECNANFISVDGSYFTSQFYGLGVRKVRDLFERARRCAPCVLFIDEVDGIGQRSSGKETSGGESEQNRIINRILVEMDGFLARDNVVVIAATNHVANIDPAMRRAGRFDSTIRISLPTLPDRKRLFDLYLERVKTTGAIDTTALARMTPGMSPSDIANMANKAASKAAETGASAVGDEHLLQAVESHQLGGDVSALKGLIGPETRERIAVHEASHALVAHWLQAGSVERVSIEPRGAALGVTFVSRLTEEPLYGEAELAGRLAMMLAGREGELLVKGNVSSGASDDLQRASELAVSMVGNFGFSRSFGLLSIAGIPKDLLGPDVQASLIAEARALLETAQRQCVELLRTRRSSLDALTALLLEHETVGGALLMGVLQQNEPG